MDLGDAFSRFSDDFARIFAGPHDDDASDPFLSVDIQRAPPEVAAQANVSHLSQQHRNTIGFRQHHLLQFFGASN